MFGVDRLLELSTISITNFWTYLHITDVRKNEITFSGFCPKDKCDERRYFKDIEIRMKREEFGFEEWDLLVELFNKCRRTGECPQVNINLSIDIYPKDLYPLCANKKKRKKK